MKLLYSLLFVLSILGLFSMDFIFLTILNDHKGIWLILLSFFGIIASVILFLFFLARFFKLPFWGNRK